MSHFYSGMYLEPTILLAVFNILQKQHKIGTLCLTFYAKKKIEKRNNAILLARKREHNKNSAFFKVVEFRLTELAEERLAGKIIN